MRIVIDMQAAQAENKSRGIGRYSLSLSRAIIEQGAKHEIILLLNGLLPDAIESIREQFGRLLRPENIVVWYAPESLAFCDPQNYWRRQVAHHIRAAYIDSLHADIVIITSFFDGYGDNAFTAIECNNTSTPSCVVLYDLIPLLNPKDYLDHSPAFKDFYLDKVAQLKHAAILLAISESAKQEALTNLPSFKNRTVNISSAIDGYFRPIKVDKKKALDLQSRYGISKQFLMYTGGIDPRKNLERLIEAFSLIPYAIRNLYQLVIVCSLQEQDRGRLTELAKQLYLSNHDMILTGYVSDDELLNFYNLCHLFVFPSRHEGFGLPVLEAMACGCAVIASNTSSLPEVVGSELALFDPLSEQAIAKKIIEVLTNEKLHHHLCQLSLERAKLFSWEATARRALLAIESWQKEQIKCYKKNLPPVCLTKSKPRLAFVSPLPAERSGISDYSAELLPELAVYYDIDVIVTQSVISDPWITSHCQQRSIQWFLENAAQFERILYHFGNSTHHEHMFYLLNKVPGVVVLHDFYLSGIVAHQEIHGDQKNAWSQELYKGHGYKALKERFFVQDTADVVWKYPCNFSVVQNSTGVIVHSEHSRHLFSQWFGQQAAKDCFVIPLLREPYQGISKDIARANLKLRPGDFVVCSFGVLGPAKLNHRLLKAWLSSGLGADPHCILIFVGSFSSDAYEAQIQDLLAECGASERVRITGWTDANTFKEYLASADAAVQLRAMSRGETSAAVLDCFNASLPTIVNRHGSMSDLPTNILYGLPDQFTDAELSSTLELLRKDSKGREQIALRAKAYLSKEHDPHTCAAQYVNCIEGLIEHKSLRSTGIIQALAKAMPASCSESQIAQVAVSLTKTFPAKYASQQILVDISELVQRDSHSGIQRVVRSILQEWLANPPANYRIEPVFATQEQGYCYARSYTLGFMSCPNDILSDEPIEFHAGDYFIGLDLQPHVVLAQKSTFQSMRQAGVRMQFVVYDLLPILMPQFFVDGAKDLYQSWLSEVAMSNQVLCISESVSIQFKQWQERQTDPLLKRAKSHWFHLGADVQASMPTTGLPNSGLNHLSELMRINPVFLMVGTVEPRKGHAQVLLAFERLWAKNCPAILVIAGKRGWLMEEFIQVIDSHPERDTRLFWLEGISDEYLEKLYAESDCLIAASEGEGFGLPLIEAAQHGLAIFARDLAVFREIAGEHASYFSDSSPKELAASLEQWLELFRTGSHLRSDRLPWQTWKQSAQHLLQLILKA